MHNWKKIESGNIKERQLEAQIYEHQVTKAKLIHLKNDDINKAFVVTFKTVPEDSTGVAHILEHTVLTGSKKYPVRDPFFSMIKRSLQSFMNAFTSEDWTAYPFASPNKQDFFNLLSIYLDASFFPLLKKENFLQEGHRLEFEGDNLVRKGVVYNEMKGAMSSPERIMVEAIKTNLFPTTNYRFNSGGDPKVIPELTYEGLKKFHKRFYHPSNATFFLYGNADVDTVLEQIDSEVMSKFDFLDPKTIVPIEKKWDKPRRASSSFTYTGDNKANKYQYIKTWLLCGIDDYEEALSLEIIDELLLGHPGASLRAKLIESGLGSDLADGSGLNSEARSISFGVGLKDIKKVSISQIDSIIENELSKIVKKGFDQEEVESALKKKELSLREFTNTPYPYGLQLWLETITPSLHGANPLEMLKFEKLMTGLRKKIKEGHLESLVEKYLINNTHRLDFTLVPDEKLAQVKETAEKDELQSRLESLSEKAMEEIKESALVLEKQQADNEDLSCLPSLKIGDIKREVRKVKINHQENIISINQNTNGLFYAGFSIDLSRLEFDDLDLLPFLSYVLTKAGTKKLSYQELAWEIQKKSGGMSAGVFAKTNLKNDKTIARLTMSAKCLPQNVVDMIKLAGDILENYSFKENELLNKFLSEYIARFEQDVVSQGHFYAMSLSAQNIDGSLGLSEKWNGLSQLRYLQELKRGKVDLSTALIELAQKALAPKPLVALIGEKSEIELAKKKIKSESIDESGAIEIKMAGSNDTAIATDTDVSFCAEAIRTVRMGHIDAPALLVMSKLLGRGFLHKEVREKGGAYGGYARYDLEEGVWYFASYRDPHIRRTFSVYNKARDFAQNYLFTREEVENAIIGCVGELEKPEAPVESARKAFARFIIGLDDETRQEFKDKLLSIGPEDITAVAKKYLSEENKGHRAVISNKEKIDEVKDLFGFEVVKL